MKKRTSGIKKIKHEYRQATRQELIEAIWENSIYGFLGSSLITVITFRIDIAVLLAYLVYYFFVGKVINRPKYITSLGKFILFPVPTSLGAFLGYKLTLVIFSFIN